MDRMLVAFNKAAHGITHVRADVCGVAVCTAATEGCEQQPETHFTERELLDIATHPLPKMRVITMLSLKAAVAKVLRQSNLNIGSFMGIEIHKSEYGLPFVHLSGGPAEHAKRAGITDVFVSSTNDAGTAFSIAAAIDREMAIDGTQTLGIGIDFLYNKTAEQMFLGCPASELRQMFTQRELSEAYGQPYQIAAARMLLALVSVKEAAFKAVSEAYFRIHSHSRLDRTLEQLSFLDIEVTGITTNSIRVTLMNQMPYAAKRAGIQNIVVKMSNQEDCVGAIAFAKGTRR